MTEKEIHVLLEKYITGECSQQEKDFLERWYADELGKKLDDHAPEESRVAKEEIWDGIISERPEIVKRKMPWRIWAGAAAVLLLGFFLYINRTEETSGLTEHLSSVVPAALHEVRVGKGESGNTIVLADGTKVTLNASTTLKYPMSFDGKSRTVFLEGEAYFEVVKNENKPFIVVLKNQRVEVLGTAFNVEAYEDETTTRVTLTNGLVALQQHNEQGDFGEKIYLKPDQRSVTDNATEIATVENVDASVASAWTNGKYKFRDETLSNITKRLEKYYGVRIQIRDRELEELRFTGTFPFGQDINEVLGILNSDNRYIVEQTNNQILIAKK